MSANYLSALWQLSVDLYESAFYHRIIKSKYCSTMTEDHLKDSMKMATRQLLTE